MVRKKTGRDNAAREQVSFKEAIEAMVMAEEKCYVYLNGKPMGNVEDGKGFAQEVRKNRRLGLVSGEINVVYKK
ncbi:RNA polymerase Rpb2, domain protein 4 domain protein, partial [mine drainage metagenome]